MSGWRWVFLVNVPIGIASLILVARTLHIPHTRREHKIDYWGAVWLVVALVPLLIVAEQGREWGWSSGKALTSYVIGVVGIVLFILAERRIGDDALLPLRLFRGRTFSVGSMLNLVVGMGMFGALAALPLYMQIVKGYTPTQAGLLLLPMVLGIMSGTILSSQFIARTGRYIWFPRIGLVLLFIAMLLLSTVNVDTSIVVVDAFAFLFGLGLGFNMQTLVLAPERRAAAGHGRGDELGDVLPPDGRHARHGDLLVGAVQRAARQDRQCVPHRRGDSAVPVRGGGSRRPGQPGEQARARHAHQRWGQRHDAALNDSSFINHLDPRLARPFLVGFSDSIHVVFLLGAVVIAVAFAIVWFLPEEKLRTQSGIQARQAQEDGAAVTQSEVLDGPADAGAADDPGGRIHRHPVRGRGRARAARGRGRRRPPPRRSRRRPPARRGGERPQPRGSRQRPPPGRSRQRPPPRRGRPWSPRRPRPRRGAGRQPLTVRHGAPASHAGGSLTSCRLSGPTGEVTRDGELEDVGPAVLARAEQVRRERVRSARGCAEAAVGRVHVDDDLGARHQFVKVRRRRQVLRPVPRDADLPRLVEVHVQRRLPRRDLRVRGPVPLRGPPGPVSEREPAHAAAAAALLRADVGRQQVIERGGVQADDRRCLPVREHLDVCCRTTCTQDAGTWPATSNTDPTRGRSSIPSGTAAVSSTRTAPSSRGVSVCV